MTKKTNFVIPTKEESHLLITQAYKTKKSKLEVLRRFFVPQNDKKSMTMNNTMIEYNEGYLTFYVYIITNKHRSTYYTGMTNNLGRRLTEHKENIEIGVKTFASKYNIEFLVYYEKFTWVEQAIAREKEIKGWKRDKKLDLIRSFNENFEFLNHRFV
jgi:putative endonuclease